MDNLAGLRLDVVDDPDLIKDSEMPELVKKATKMSRVISSKDYSSMNRDDFALVIMTKNGHHIPKYPIHDKVHAWAANETFNKTAHRLPPDARVIAATFIKRACKFYNIPYHKTLDLMSMDDLTDNSYGWNKKSNLISQNQEREPIEAIVPLDPEESGSLYGSSYQMPNADSESDKRSRSILLSKNVKNTTRSVLSEKVANAYPDSDFGIVTNNKRLYPMFTKELMAEAQIQFDKNAEKMAPKFRREFATKIASKLQRTGWPCFAKLSNYVGNEFSPELRNSIRIRKGFLCEVEDQNSYEVLYEKRAMLGPEKFAELLEGLDKHYGLDRYWDNKLLDPYATTYSHKTAGEYTDTYLWDSGEEVVSGLQIKKLAEEPSLLAGFLDPDIIKAFMVDPIDIFESLPRPQKMLIVRAIKGDLTKLQGQNIQKVAESAFEAGYKGKNEYGKHIKRDMPQSAGVGALTGAAMGAASKRGIGGALLGAITGGLVGSGAHAVAKATSHFLGRDKLDTENLLKIMKGNPQRKGERDDEYMNRIAPISNKTFGTSGKIKRASLRGFVNQEVQNEGMPDKQAKKISTIQKTVEPRTEEGETSKVKRNLNEEESLQDTVDSNKVASIEDIINKYRHKEASDKKKNKLAQDQTGAGDIYKPGKIISKPKIIGSNKPLMGGKAIKPVIPIGPLTTGVKVPSPRTIDKSASISCGKGKK